MLLNDALSPLTSTIGFVDAPCRDAANAYLRWQISLVDGDWIAGWTPHRVSGDLESVLRRLLPLKKIESTRRLFLPTRSGWTAYVDNRWIGADPFPVLHSLVETLHCRGIRMTAVPPNPKATPQQGPYGGTIFELYTPDAPGRLRVARSLNAVQDGGRWTFDATGTPLPFEEPGRYTSRRIRDRFDAALLDRYLRTLGIEAFDAAFYLPDAAEGILLEARGGIDGPRNADVALDEAQARR